MEKAVFSVALVRKLDESGIRWMARKNPATGLLRFVLGQPTDGQSLREAVTQAVAWELELDRKRDFLVSSMAQLNYVFPDSVPAVRGDVPLSVSFYNIEIYRRLIMQMLDDDPLNTWVTSEEIWEGQTTSGQIIDPLIQQLITQSQVIRSWESSAGETA